MKIGAMFAFAVFGFACTLGLAQTPTSKKATPTPTTAVKKAAAKEEFKVSAEEQAVIDLTNAERKKEGLKPLKANPLLFAAARKHTVNMAKQDKLEHDLDDKSPFDRIKAENYKYSRAAENIAMGQETPAKVVDAWMKSEGHRKNILTKELTEIGIGIAKNSQGRLYWTQVFGTPR